MLNVLETCSLIITFGMLFRFDLRTMALYQYQTDRSKRIVGA